MLQDHSSCVFVLSKYLYHLHDKCFPALIIFLLKLYSFFLQLQFFLGPSFLHLHK